MRTPFAVAITTFLALAFAGPAAAANYPVTLSPHQFVAGTKSEVTLSAKNCFNEQVTVSAPGVLAGGKATLVAHAGPEVFTGTLRFAESAKGGSRALKIDCGGTRFGPAVVQIEAAKNGGHPKSQTHVNTQTLRIGWSYTHVNQWAERQTLKPVDLQWNKCYDKGGTRVDYPKGSGVYDESKNVPGHFSLDAKGRHFHGNVYAGAANKVGTKTVTLACRRHGKVVLKEKLALHFVQHPFAGTQYFGYQALSPGITNPTTVHAAACRDPHIKTITIDSQSLTKDAAGARSVTLARSGTVDFKAPETGATDVAPGTYPAPTFCGGHLISSPTLQLLPPLN